MHFLDLYQEYTAPCKGSARFHLWSAVALASAALERRVWVQKFKERVFPNLYVVLVGLPGCGKTFASRTAMEIIYRFNASRKGHGIFVTTDKLTPAAMIDQLKAAEKTFSGGGFKYIYHSLFSHSSELSSMITDIGGGSLVTDLLKFYDSDKAFTKDTKKDGLVEIENVSFACLWDTTTEFLRKFIPQELTGEGFTSRLILATDLKDRRFDRIPPTPDLKLEKSLDDKFSQMALLFGPIEEDPEATEFLNYWHNETWPTARFKLPRLGSFAGYYSRKSAHLEKLCMVLAGCRGSKKVRLEDAERAVQMLDDLEPQMRKAFGHIDGSRLDVLEETITAVIREKSLTEGELFQAARAEGVQFVPDESFESRIRGLDKAGVIKISRNANGERTFSRVPKVTDD